MLMSEEKRSKEFICRFPFLLYQKERKKKRKSANAAVWHQVYSQRDYHDPLMDV